MTTALEGGWLGPRAGLYRCGKSRLPPVFDLRTVQPVAGRYTDYATRPTFVCRIFMKSRIIALYKRFGTSMSFAKIGSVS